MNVNDYNPYLFSRIVRLSNDDFEILIGLLNFRFNIQSPPTLSSSAILDHRINNNCQNSFRLLTWNFDQVN